MRRGQTGYGAARERAADAVVVGAGPAGSMTALFLARNGLDVLVLDRAAFPRPKPCGDCLSAAATGLLDRAGLLDRVRAAGAAEIRRWDIVAPDGGVATGGFPERPALALERRVLDAVLLDAAIEAGARFQQRHVTGLYRDGGVGGAGGEPGRVRGVVTRAGGTLEAPLVVGADGLRSVVARELDVIRRTPRLRKVSLTAHVSDPPTARGPSSDAPGGVMEHGEMHVLEDGCLGFAPAGPGRYNLTLVVSGRRADGLREQGPDAFFRSWLAKVPALDRRFGHGELGPLLASGPFDWPTRRPVAHGAALVGDAAGYYDPFTGQGIYQAMAAAEALARDVAPTLAALRADAPTDQAAGQADRQTRADRALDGALRRYAAAKGRLTRPARRVQRLVEAVVSRPRLADAVMGRLGRATPAMDRLIEVTGDLRPPLSLLSPVVVSSFLFPADLERP